MKREIMNAVKAKCLDCSCGQIIEVRLCPITDCPLYPYRLGKDPNPKKYNRVITDEQKSQFAERMQKYRENKEINQ